MEIKEMIEFLESSRMYVGFNDENNLSKIIKLLQNMSILISRNPYPEDIFTPIPKEDFAKINELLKKEMGYPIDRLSGNIGRKLYKSITEILKE